jgi:hypothetical protein
MKTLTIPQKMSGTGSIHDIASDLWERTICFPENHQYAVVLAAFYGGKGYTVHRTEEAVIQKIMELKDYTHYILDVDGHSYEFDGFRLVKAEDYY